jgi:hypothetical protein
LHVKVHVLLLHSGVALATPVVHGCAHPPQSFTLLVVLTHTPLHSVGVAAGQPETHVEFWHAGVPPLHAYAAPQPPQSLLSLVKSTHAPSQGWSEPVHVKPHVLSTQSAMPLTTLVVQLFAHVWQSFTSLVVSTHAPPQSVGVATGQPETHTEFWHSGVPPLQAYVDPQPPQSSLSLVKSTHAPLQRVYPLLHVKVHAPETHAAVALAMPVEQAFVHEPQ